jgi:excisionase family DNA binding protein
MGKLLTIEQVSDILQVHPNTIRHWSNNGSLKSIRIGPRRDRRFDEDEVKRFIENNKKEGEGDSRAKPSDDR